MKGNAPNIKVCFGTHDTQYSMGTWQDYYLFNKKMLHTNEAVHLSKHLVSVQVDQHKASLVANETQRTNTCSQRSYPDIRIFFLICQYFLNITLKCKFQTMLNSSPLFYADKKLFIPRCFYFHLLTVIVMSMRSLISSKQKSILSAKLQIMNYLFKRS